MTITPSSEVRLCNVPFLIDGKDTMDFSSKTEQTNYFLGKTIANGNVGDDFSYVRQFQSVKVPIECDFIRNCNYMMYKNDLYSGKWFYAFVTEVRYVNPNTTEIFFSIDVFQTWQFDITFKPSFIERSHVDRWNSDGTPVQNTLDEGLYYGEEYDVVQIQNYIPLGDVSFLVIGCKNTLHDVSQVVIKNNGIPQPLSFYICPFRKSNGGSPPNNVGTSSTIQAVLEAIYSDPKAVNNIVSLCVTDYIGIDCDFNGSTLTFTDPTKLQSKQIGTSGAYALYLYGVPVYDNMLADYGDKYSGYKSVKESKLLMYPYTTLTLTDCKGQQVTYRNEFIKGTELNVRVRGSIGTSNKVSYTVDDYLYDSGSAYSKVNDLGHSLVCNDPNDVPIITDLLSAYLQGNKNSLANQKAQIHFNMKMDTYKGIASAVVGGSQQGTDLWENANNLNLISKLGGAVSTGIGTLQGRGNQQLALNGMMAKQQDIANTPPSIGSLGSNAYFDYGNTVYGCYLVKRQIKQEYIDRLEDYFGMFGYKVHRVQTPNFKSREHFNYIKTNGVTIIGNCPQNDLNQIKAMFDNGVTVWHVDDVGNYSLSNNEVS